MAPVATLPGPRFGYFEAAQSRCQLRCLVRGGTAGRSFLLRRRARAFSIRTLCHVAIAGYLVGGHQLPTVPARARPPAAGRPQHPAPTPRVSGSGARRCANPSTTWRSHPPSWYSAPSALSHGARAVRPHAIGRSRPPPPPSTSQRREFARRHGRRRHVYFEHAGHSPSRCRRRALSSDSGWQSRRRPRVTLTDRLSRGTPEASSATSQLRTREVSPRRRDPVGGGRGDALDSRRRGSEHFAPTSDSVRSAGDAPGLRSRGRSGHDAPTGPRETNLLTLSACIGQLTRARSFHM